MSTQFTPEFGTDGKIPEDGRLEGAAFKRNQMFIRDALTVLLAGRKGDVLEVGSGTGQHAVSFASAMPDLTWWPSDPIARHCASIEGWRRHADRPNLRPPFELDARAADWELGQTGRPPAHGLTAIVAVNIMHITPWEVSLGLLAGAGRHLGKDGLLAVYGPFRIDGSWTANSNAEFDAALREENKGWGVRDTAEIANAAHGANLVLADTLKMPKNNFILLFARND